MSGAVTIKGPEGWTLIITPEGGVSYVKVVGQTVYEYTPPEDETIARRVQ